MQRSPPPSSSASSAYNSSAGHAAACRRPARWPECPLLLRLLGLALLHLAAPRLVELLNALLADVHVRQRFRSTAGLSARVLGAFVALRGLLLARSKEVDEEARLLLLNNPAWAAGEGAAEGEGARERQADTDAFMTGCFGALLKAETRRDERICVFILEPLQLAKAASHAGGVCGGRQHRAPGPAGARRLRRAVAARAPAAGHAGRAGSGAAHSVMYRLKGLDGEATEPLVN